MDASDSCCRCASCGAVCTGRFPGCQQVWDRGPQRLTVIDRPSGRPESPPDAGGSTPMVEQSSDQVRADRWPAEREDLRSELARTLDQAMDTLTRRLEGDQEERLGWLLDQIEKRLAELAIPTRPNHPAADQATHPSTNGNARWTEARIRLPASESPEPAPTEAEDPGS